ncbi:MAG TPA: hypothetical protein VGR64_06515, partial [Terracidiphilus sp.]|nr:hypothetical protein [Terracidiphilus sp.]
MFTRRTQATGSRLDGPMNTPEAAEVETSPGQLDLFREERGPERRIWPVRELVEHARQVVEQRFADL